MGSTEGKATLQLVPEGIGKENEIYTQRFSPAEERSRQITWQVLVKEFFQPYVGPNDVVVDIGAGDGLFIKNIKARRRIAVDLSDHVQDLTRFGVEVIQVPASELSQKLDEPADVIFMSNFLEHLPTKNILLEILAECRRCLKPGGVVMILQPNIRYVGSAYWDYIDHHIALTEHSLVEALEVSGFSIVRLIPRFLPYTAKSTLGRVFAAGGSERLIRWYLKLPLLWRVLGKQTFVVAAPARKK